MVLFNSLFVFCLISLARKVTSQRPIGQIRSAMDSVSEITESYRNRQPGQKTLMIFDYNGPLVGKTNRDPESAKAFMTKLASNPDHTVWIITSKQAKTMEEFADIRGLNLGTDYGVVARFSNGRDDKLTYDGFTNLQDKVEKIAAATRVKLQDRGNVAAVAYDTEGNSEANLQNFFAKLRKDLGLGTRSSKYVFENKEKKGFFQIAEKSLDKGPRVEQILRDPGRYNLVLTFGDKNSDEGMHRAANNANVKNYAVLVREELTTSSATHRLGDHEQVRQFVDRITRR